VNNRKLTDFSAYWRKAADRLMHLEEIKTPVNFIVHSLRDVNTARCRAGTYSSICAAMALRYMNSMTSR